MHMYNHPKFSNCNLVSESRGEIMSVYLAEWLKLKRSPIKSLPLITSIVFSILLVGYFSLREKTSIVPVQVCKVFLEVWSIMVIPMGIGILSGFMIHQ